VREQRNDKLGRECNQFLQFMFAAETKDGARSILMSANKGNPIRVFRLTT
jgi:hypothetical protein